jgi:hypothetical protein
MRTRPLVMLLLAAVLLLGSSPALSVAQSSDDRNERYDEINLEMENIRELDLLAPINLSIKTRETLRTETVADLETDYPAIERQNDNRVLVAFGLMDADLDVGAIYGDLLSEQVAGYYDPSTDEMVVVSDDAPDAELSASDQVTYAHETVHALQDQHFDLETFLEDREELSDDASLAITALIEGDATAAQIEFLKGTPSLLRDLSTEMEGDGGSTEALDSAPAIITETLIFPYVQGQVFVSELLEDGGWDRVNEAFTSLPASTEQILHPEKYFDGEDPVVVDLPDVADALGPGWEAFDTNTMGEFQTSVILDEGDVSSGDAEDAAEGWGGDRYTVVGTDDQAVILWESVWDSEDDAEEFADTLVDREESRLEGSSDESDSTTLIESEQGVVQVEVRGDAVTFIFAPDQQLLETVAALGT